MRNIMKKTASIVLAAALVVSLAPANADAAKKVKLSSKSKTIAVKKSFTLKVKNGSKKAKVTWKTSNKKVAALSKQVKKGNKASVKVTGKKKGSAKIMATYKLGKKKTKLTCKVTVGTVAPTAAPTTAATVAPTAAPTIAATVAPTTAAPSATPAKTQRPKKTAGPTATPTPEPTKPADMKDAPSAPYNMVFADAIITFQGSKASATINDDGSVTISNAELYGGISFELPETVTDNNFDTVTVTYRDVVNIGGGYGCGLWRGGEDKDSETVMAYGGVFADKDEDGNPITSGTYVASLKGDNTLVGNTWFVKKILLFHNDESVHTMTPSAQVTIDSIVFSHSEYVAPEGGDATPTPTPGGEGEGTETTPTPAPAADFKAVKVESAFTVDGTAEEAWDAIEALPFLGKHDKKEHTSTTTATAKLAWDANNLYGLVTVADDSIDATAGNDYERDGVEFFLDEDNDAVTGWDNNTDAFQYRFTGLTKDAEGAKLAPLTKIFAGGSAAAKETYAGVEAEYTFVEGGYVVEFKIPFVAEKATGARVGFDAIVQDCTDGARNAELYLGATDRELSYWNLADTFKTLELVEPEVPTDFTAKKAAAAFTVDGVADDAWADFEEINFTSRIKCDNSGDSTTSATAKLAWDANNLYGLVKVTDANIDAANSNDWQRDGIEFFLDEDNDAVKTFDANTDAFQYRFTGLTKDGDAKVAALTNGFAGGSAAARTDYAGIVAEYSYIEGGYVVEFKIPFKTAKEAGAIVGFDALVQDCANGLRDAEIYLGATDRGMSYYNLADTFKTLKLAD